MNWKTTLVLLVLVAGLGAWVYWGESQTEKTGETPKQRVIPKFKVDDATRVEIQRGADLKDTIVLAKAGADWRMEKPLADKADDGKVRELLSPLEFLDATAVREGEDAKKADFGAVVKRLTVARPQEKGGDFTIELGPVNVGECSARVVGKDAVYLIKKDLADRLDWEVFLFRNKEVFSVAQPDIARISAKLPSLDAGPGAPPRLVELAKGGDHAWRVGGTDGELAEMPRVNEVLSKIHDLKAMGAQTDAPADPDLAKWGLSPAEVEVTIASGDEKNPKTETLALGKKIDPTKNDERWARVSGRPTVYRVDATDLVKELSRDPAQFRTDALVPLAAGTEGVTAFSVKWKDGREVALKKSDNKWSFELPSKADADSDAVRSLVKSVADLKVSTREAGTDFGKVGLAEPSITITASEGDAKHTLAIGSALDGGVFNARRGDEARIFTTKLGDLAKRLEDAPIALRTKTLLKASHWDLQAWKLTGPDGKVASAGEKQGNDWHIEGMKIEDVDTAKITKAFEPMDDLRADALVALVTSESVAQYGLDQPRTLALTTESWEAGSDKKKKEEKTLLLGKREGAFTYAIEKGGTVIGKVKAEFLDLIERGFRRGKEIFTFASYDCFSFSVKEGGNEILKLEKRKEGATDEWFLGSQKLVNADVLDKLLRPLDKLEGFQAEDATADAKKARGIDAPWRTITVQTKPSWGDKKDEVTTKTLVLGQRAGEHDIWAMDAAGTQIAQIYDGPIKKIDEFAAAPPVAPGEKKEEKKDGTAPVGSPTAPNK